MISHEVISECESPVFKHGEQSNGSYLMEVNYEKNKKRKFVIMDRKYVQEKVKEVEDSIWKNNVTRKDKVYGGLKIGIVVTLTGLPLLLLGALLLAVLLATLQINVVPFWVAIIVSSYVTVLLASGICFLEDKIINKTMDRAIDKVKKRCQNEMTLCGMKQLSKELKKEYLCLQDNLCDVGNILKKNETIDPDIIKNINKSINDIEWLRNLIIKKYENIDSLVKYKLSGIEKLKSHNINIENIVDVENNVQFLNNIKVVHKNLENYLKQSPKCNMQNTAIKQDSLKGKFNVLEKQNVIHNEVIFQTGNKENKMEII